jgi:hypothetical protein
MLPPIVWLQSIAPSSLVAMLVVLPDSEVMESGKYLGGAGVAAGVVGGVSGQRCNPRSHRLGQYGDWKILLQLRSLNRADLYCRMLG